ncbi:hypothetical protein G6F46_003330 [Rhizopus delemar]|nr:hypothetical protein G6F49_004475 [Rhizopus delemar]KAG1589201.1 hypothetical protein G6F48_004777 [Rhizopus delemar]KAG1619223.1 hypothetical protein G6F46_003330 [Rhizopus delemar]
MHPTRRFGRQNRTQAVINDTQPIAPSTRRNTTRVNRQGSSILLNSGSSTTSSVRRATQEATQAAAAVTGPPSLPGFIHYLQHIQDQDRNSTSSDSVRTHLPNYRIYGNEENETNNRSFLRGERNNSRTTLASSGASIVTSNSTRRMHILVIEYRQNTSSDNISTRTQSTTHRPSLLSRSFQRLGRPRSEVSTSSSTDTLQSMPLSMHTNASHTTSHPFSQEGQWIVYVLNGSHPPQPSLSFMDDNPTYEDLLLLTQMLGPARPSTTTQAAVDEAIPAVDWSDDTKKKLKDDQCLVCLDEFDLKQSMTITEPYEKALTIQTMNPLIKNVEYAVRGQLAIRAEELRQELAEGKEYPFDRIVNCNIGNPQQLNQQPITFFRQVSSLCDNPDLLKKENFSIVSQLYPLDAIQRARSLLASIGSVGSYSHSQGVPAIRHTVAQFIKQRDGYGSDPNHIFLTQGASSGVQTLLSMLTQDSNSGIMIPIPQYPLYSASLALYGATPVPYYLDEETGWSLSVDQLTEVITTARSQGTKVKALVIINPGNPTGQCLSAENMQDIVDFCWKQRIVLLADEVYQTNIYQPKERPFISFKKALMEHSLARDHLELVSFHSISKGMIGECGRRGGYFECVNLDKQVLEQIYKMASVSLCPNLHGQILVDLMCNPPRLGDPSYESYKEEIERIYESLRRRSKKLEKVFNQMEGVSCQPAHGSMYLFPQVTLPPKAIKKANELNMAPDAYYAMAMLEATGVCVVPGSGFGQKDHSWHFRSTFLPEEHLFDEFCNALLRFHQDFIEKYS